MNWCTLFVAASLALAFFSVDCAAANPADKKSAESTASAQDDGQWLRPARDYASTRYSGRRLKKSRQASTA
jgi:glucose dehydrogenase